jgi:hypothetical protein
MRFVARRVESIPLHRRVQRELGNRRDLAYCYANWGLLAREQRDRNTEREKLAAALVIFTDLKMPRERDAVRAELKR